MYTTGIFTNTVVSSRLLSLVAAERLARDRLLLAPLRSAILLARTILGSTEPSAFSSLRGGVFEPLQRRKPTWQTRIELTSGNLNQT